MSITQSPRSSRLIVEKENPKVHSIGSAAAIHRINGQLLEMLFGNKLNGKSGILELSLLEPEGWIINTLYISSDSMEGSAGQFLRTSSTFHRGTVYDANSVRNSVLALDETVPIETSMSGRSFVACRPIWLFPDDLLVSSDSPLGSRLYRDFSLVDVETGYRQRATGEILFPIVLRTLSNHCPLGVLNLEFFSESRIFKDVPLVVASREIVNELLSEFLSVHASFLRTALEHCQSAESGLSVDSHLARLEDGIAAAHEFALVQCRQRNTELIQLIESTGRARA